MYLNLFQLFHVGEQSYELCATHVVVSLNRTQVNFIYLSKSVCLMSLVYFRYITILIYLPSTLSILKIVQDSIYEYILTNS